MLVPVGGLQDSLKWHLSDGPDFYIYRAESKESGVGIYFGLHPNFQVDEKEKKESSHLLATKVEWFQSKEESRFQQWETLIPYEHSPEFMKLKLHLWVWGSDEEQIKSLVSKLESLSLEEATNRSMVNQAVQATRASAPVA